MAIVVIPTAVGTITNTVRVTSDTSDLIPNNDAARVDAEVVLPVPKVRFNPETVNLSNIGDSEVITVEALDIPVEVDGVQINLQSPSNLSVSEPRCLDLFGGGLVIGTVPISASGTLVGCVLLGVDVNDPPDGDAMTFELTQLGDCVEPSINSPRRISSDCLR